MVILVLLSACARGTVSDNSGIAALTITVAPGIPVDTTMLLKSMKLLLDGAPAGSDTTIELFVYGHSRGRELFLYNGDEHATVKNIEENMSIAVLVKIKKSGFTTGVLFAEASGEGDEHLLKNAAREIAARLSGAGFRTSILPKR
ncbi:MAG TPA: hypothetical protein VLM75_09790 [Spirochaetota bacterium]|nr:hypothetical protein [Spirochaetota bacterium]